MADDAQDLEVEDILSSIKNILEEDEGVDKTVEQQLPSEQNSDVLDSVLSSDLEDDVLELSQDMRINNEPMVEEAVEVAPAVEEVTEPEPVVEEVAEVVAPAVEEVAEPEPVVEEVAEVVAPAVEDTVDASANIINNFAKMFAKDKSETAEEVKPQVESLGDGSHTLENFVRDAIIKVIGEDITKQWNNGAEYRMIAEAEIKRQVQSWLNDNLSTAVENIVKEEMKRVMAKAGSQG